ncbi:hypothetical protein [uncultured Polaribacter sp.]|uniref:hypothetical protein n=1 Tax=uncultured Polaribacter sp. TaxID=174711 RepID=UPI00260D326E|nr:hypothetical protein [uncultured Polaribacter sp.]
MKSYIILFLIIFPITLFSQIKKTSNVYKFKNGKYYKVGKVVKQNDWKSTTLVYKNINGSDILIGKAYDQKVYAKDNSGNFKEVMSIERDNNSSKFYFFKNGNLIGKGSWWKNEIYKATGYNFWDGNTFELAGKIDGGGENKSLGAGLLLIYN